MYVRRVMRSVLAAVLLAAVAAPLLSRSVSSAAPSRVLRVNAGGRAVARGGWRADSRRRPSRYVNARATTTMSTRRRINMSHRSLPSNVTQKVVRTARIDRRGGPAMHWDLGVQPGAYRVRLYFAETARRAQSRRARVFDVRVEGATVLDNLDVFAAAGGFKAIARSFRVRSDANLDIDFRGVIGNPIVNALEVVPVPKPTEPQEAAQPDGAGDFSPRPDDGAPCHGTVISPEDDLVAAVNGTSGRTFCLLPGTHDIGTRTIQPGSGTKLIGAPVTINAPGTITAPTKIRGSSPDGIVEFSRPATDVLIENLDICCAPGNKLDEDNSTKQLGRGINGSSQRATNLTVRLSRIHGNANAGIGGLGEGAVIHRVELDHNGSDSYLGCCAGGIKSADFFSITHSYVHDNVGNGIWVDSGGSFVVTDNVVRNNTRNGIRYENSTGYARILRNVVQNNSTSQERPGGGIEVNSADDAEIAFNTLGRNFNAGIIFRGGRSPVSGVAYNNVLNGDRLECSTTSVSCYDNDPG